MVEPSKLRPNPVAKRECLEGRPATASTAATAGIMSWADLADEEDEELGRAKEASRIIKVADDMRAMLNVLGTKSDIAEAYSPHG